MTNSDSEFDDWFDCLKMHVLDRTGVEFRDAAAVRADYDTGRNMHDVVDEIAAEYGEAE